MSDTILTEVRNYLHITWIDEVTDNNLNGFISRGKARLQQIAGAPLTFVDEDLSKALLLDYCRYANSQALEMFEKNFTGELMSLHIQTQVDLEPDIVEVTI